MEITLSLARPGFEVRAAASRLSDVALSTLLVCIIDVAALCSTTQMYHWFLLPVTICGILMGRDAVAWLRGRVDIYDPAGLLGVIGFHFFFLAPLLHIYWDMWMPEVAPPPDWRDWLGYMGLLNCAGLLFYRWCRDRVQERSAPWLKPRNLDRRRISILFPIAIAGSMLAQVWVYARMGGISGYMNARMQDPVAFDGMGVVFMLSECAPVLLGFWMILWARKRHASMRFITAGLLVVIVAQAFFGGLRGSRSESVQLLFWIVGGVHFLARPVTRRFVCVGSAFLLVFLYLYGFYKNMGQDAGVVITGTQQDREYAANKTGRTTRALVLWDLGRSDVQAFILYRLQNDARDYQRAWGRTYLGSLSLLIPHSLFPDRPETKIKEGTEIQAGIGTYIPRVASSSRVYGLAGEGMLNFGPAAVPILYGLFGLWIGLMRRLAAFLPSGDARLLLLPFLIYVSVNGLAGDSDNTVFGVVKDGAVPALIVYLCSRRAEVIVNSPADSCSVPALNLCRAISKPRSL